MRSRMLACRTRAPDKMTLAAGAPLAAFTTSLLAASLTDVVRSVPVAVRLTAHHLAAGLLEAGLLIAERRT